MRDLHIIVNNKIATYLNRDGSIVCRNKDYQIVFSFDSEWDAYGMKVARFIWNNGYRDIPFTGNTVAVPEIFNAKQLKVGVYAGDLNTTTPAVIDCEGSILCEHGLEEIPEPTPELYRQILEECGVLASRVAKLEENEVPGGSGATVEEVLAAMPKVSAVDFSNFENGSFAETVDGEAVTHSVVFNSSGRPVLIDNIAITWGV